MSCWRPRCRAIQACMHACSQHDHGRAMSGSQADMKPHLVKVSVVRFGMARRELRGRPLGPRFWQTVATCGRDPCSHRTASPRPIVQAGSVSPQHVLRAGAAVSNQRWPGQAHSSPRQEEEATSQEGSSCSSDRGSSSSAYRGWRCCCCVHLSTCSTCSTCQHSVTACSSSTSSSGTNSTSASSACCCQGCFQALGLQAADVEGDAMLKQACSKLASCRPLMLPACMSSMRYAMCQHQGGYPGQSPNKTATVAAPGVSLRVGSAAVSLRPGIAAAGAASGPSPPKSKAVPLAKRQKDVQVCGRLCEWRGACWHVHRGPHSRLDHLVSIQRAANAY